MLSLLLLLLLLSLLFLLLLLLCAYRFNPFDGAHGFQIVAEPNRRRHALAGLTDRWFGRDGHEAFNETFPRPWSGHN
jgi:hypothetical protein